MVISHKHKFVFIAIPKCATTSMELPLMPYNEIGLRKHTPAKDIPECAAHHFKFAFVRNPFERFVSLYKQWQRNKHLDTAERRHLYHLSKDVEFSDFVTRLSAEKGLVKWCMNSESALSHIMINGEVATDFIGRVENLQPDFNEVCAQIGIPCQELSYLNSSKHRPYRECYTKEAKETTSRLFENDIRYFGYEW